MENVKEQKIGFKGYLHIACSNSDKSYLIGSKCNKCGFVVFPKRSTCPKCLERTMEITQLHDRGIIHSFCVSRVTPPGFASPNIQAWIDLDDGPRIYSVIKSEQISDDAMKIGSFVELCVDTLYQNEKGEYIVGYKFKLKG